jgi:hypothetical protein
VLALSFLIDLLSIYVVAIKLMANFLLFRKVQACPKNEESVAPKIPIAA